MDEIERTKEKKGKINFKQWMWKKLDHIDELLRR